MGSLKSQCRMLYRSSINTITLNCLVFEKIAFLYSHFVDRRTKRQTDGQTDGQRRCVKALLAIATGALIISKCCEWVKLGHINRRDPVFVIAHQHSNADARY